MSDAATYNKIIQDRTTERFAKSTAETIRLARQVGNETGDRAAPSPAENRRATRLIENRYIL